MNNRLIPLAILAFTMPVRCVAYAADTGPSFDCSRAATIIEQHICANPELSAADAKLSKLFAQLMAISSSQAMNRMEQKNWLEVRRNSCPDDVCLERAYAKRIALIETEINENSPSADVQANSTDTVSGAVTSEPAEKRSLKSILGIAQLLPCDAPELEKAADDAMADTYDAVGFPEVAIKFRHPQHPWNFHDSTDEQANAVLAEALHSEIDEKHMKICTSKLPTLVEYIKGFKLHGLVLGFGIPNAVAEF